jgi:hypothetical protein
MKTKGLVQNSLRALSLSANEPRITQIWIRIHLRNLRLKITAAFRVPTIAIEFDRVARALT